MEKIKGIFNGIEKEYDVILTFHSNKQNKDYIVYTDNSYDEKGSLKIYAAIYNPNLDEPFIGYPVETEEWAEIRSVIDQALLNK